MIILGINAFHADASAAILVDGKLVAAVEEERFRRVKHWAGFPTQAIAYCLEEAGIRAGDVDHLAINQDGSANLRKKLLWTLANRPDLSLILKKLKTKKERASAVDLFRAEYPDQKICAELHHVEHHLAHLSSAFHCSPFDEASIVSVDGFGDFASAAWGRGSGASIDVEERVYFPHSLGVFYQAMTQYLGFPNYGDEYKVMGLASYGKPRFMDQMRQLVLLQNDGSFKLNLDYFHHHRTKVEYEWEGGSPRFGQLFAPAMEDLLGPVRQKGEPLETKHHDLAHSIQAMYEEAFFHLLNTLHAKHGSDSLTVAGGCGMNSVANGRIRSNTPYRHTYVQAAAGDAGGALGAALTVWHQSGQQQRIPMKHALWGPAYSAQQSAALLVDKQAELDAADCTVTEMTDSDELCGKVVNCLEAGGVVGWFQGRMEWGPRALGSRSILGDPRRGDMKDILNHKIKRRESFRPFAPSVLREHVSEWFDEDDDVPFMMKVFPIRKDKRELIPAVCHVDGTGRLQTVHQDTNPLYWQLIEKFRSATGVPMLLNTSFNENEPIVCQPSEALDCFLRTNMDMLVLGNTVIERKTVSA